LLIVPAGFGFSEGIITGGVIRCDFGLNLDCECFFLKKVDLVL